MQFRWQCAGRVGEISQRIGFTWGKQRNAWLKGWLAGGSRGAVSRVRALPVQLLSDQCGELNPPCVEHGKARRGRGVGGFARRAFGADAPQETERRGTKCVTCDSTQECERRCGQFFET